MGVPRDDRVGGRHFERPNPVKGSGLDPGNDNKLEFRFSRTVEGRAPIDSGPVNVRVDGSRVVEGPQTAEILGLLGIDEAEIDDAWYRFVFERNRDFEPAQTPAGQYHQDGMGWEVEVEIRPDDGEELRVKEIRELAYVDPRIVERTFTYRANQWTNERRGGPGDLFVTDRQPVVVYDVQQVAPAGALGAFWSGVDDDDIESTRQAASSLQGAREEIEKALQEMDVALRVAGVGWKGARADVMKFKLGMEYEVVDGLRQMVSGWEESTRDLVKEQEEAKDRDNDLLWELGIQLVTGIAAGAITYGAGTAVRTGTAAVAIARAARAVDAIRAVMQTRLGTRLAAFARTKTAINGLQVLSRGSADAATNWSIQTAQGEPAMDSWRDWAASYLAVGAVGHAGNKSMAALLDRIGRRTLGEGSKGAAQSSVSGLGVAIAQESINPDGQEADALIAGYVIGLPAGAASSVLSGRSRARIVDDLKGDYAQMTAARQRVLERLQKEGKSDGKTHDVHTVNERVKKDLETTASRKVDPLAELLGVTTETAATAAARQGGPALVDAVTPPEMTAVPGGYVRQPV